MEEQAMKFEEKLKALVEMGKKKKNILEIQEVNEVFSDMELEAGQMDKVIEYVEAQGIDVLQMTPDVEEDLPDDMYYFQRSVSAGKVQRTLQKSLQNIRGQEKLMMLMQVVVS